MGPEQLGLLALIEAYTRVVDRLIRLEPWQALIKYGADALEGDRREIKRLRTTVIQIDLVTGGLAAGVLAGIALNIDLVLGLTVGPDYADAGILVILQLLATTTALFGTALRPALLSMGLQVQLLKIVIVATLGFYATLAVALPLLGVVGASIAHIVLNTLWLLAACVVFARRIRREARSGDAVPVGVSG